MQSTNHRSPRTAHVAALALLAAASVWFAAATVPGLQAAYSYWFDELYSVVISRDDLGSALRLTFEDVHPPLYQVILWAWMSLFGSGESATRALSVVAMLAGLGVLLSLRRHLGLTTTLVLSSFVLLSPQTVYYAQETRSYALLLFLGCLCLRALVTGDRRLLYVSALLLGLTHYFGAILGSLALVYLVLTRPTPRTFLAALAVFCVIAVWPAAQLATGSTADLLGGNFWIRTGARHAVELGIAAAWPGLDLLMGKVSGALGLAGETAETVAAFGVVAVVIMLGLAVVLFARRDAKLLMLAGGTVGALVFVVGALSLHTPLATSRNFIELVPFGALALAIPLARALRGPVWASVPAMAFCALYATVSISHSATQMAVRKNPSHPYQALLAHAEAAAEAGDVPLFLYDVKAPVFRDIMAFYLSEPDQAEAMKYAEGEADLPPDFILLFLNESCERLGEDLERLSKSYQSTEIDGTFSQGCDYTSGALRLSRS